ncbi:MAG TPA: radical SAM protein [Thermodesulfobacteriota bacterium]|nr:radical SAM protein [Thermodesulfobacteriota bacterium]
MTKLCFEQGPIRPPSEAHSLLLRVTRNCPWNRCEFCHTYKEEKFSIRTSEEVKKDIDVVQEIVSEVRAWSWKYGFGGEIAAPLINSILQDPKHDSDGFRSVALWLYSGGKNVFLQDGDNLILKTSELVEIMKYLKKVFPSIERITTYARAKTISRKKIEELGDLRRAGLSRIHIGLETGCGPLLQFVKKGVTAQEHVEAGRRVRESGISLSEYVILGLGGKGLWREHAVETAKVLNQINADFIRVRTLKVLKTMLLYRKIEKGEFVLMNDDETIGEERLLIDRLEGITSTFVSDHILNLLQEVEGKLPEEKEKMLSLIDRYLLLPEEEKNNFRFGRRVGVYQSVEDLSRPELRNRVERVLRQIESERPGSFEEVLSELTESFI